MTMMTIMGSSSSTFCSSSLQPRLCKSSFIDYSKYLSSEDLLFEIFRRLPLKSIFKYRCISKLWLSVLSNPSFIARMIDYTFTSPPWTLFCQLNDHFTVPHPAFVQLFKTASPPIYSQFIFDHDGFCFRFLLKAKIYLLASSNGLVLCSRSDFYQREYYVCNPLTKKWVSLPPPRQCSTARLVLNGFICDSSPLTFASTYKVVRIPLFSVPKTEFDLEIFSSDIGGWETHKVSCPQEVTLLYDFWSNAVTLNGILYWMEGQNRIIAYNLNNKNRNSSGHECRLINLPKEIEGHKDYFYDRCLGESEGFISYCQIQRRQRTMSVLVLEEDFYNGEWVWHLVYKNIQLKDIIAAAIEDGIPIRKIEESIIYMRPLAFDPLDRTSVILSSQSYIFTYNFRTRRAQLLHQTSSYLFEMWHKVLPFVLTPKPTTIPAPFRSIDQT